MVVSATMLAERLEPAPLPPPVPVELPPELELPLPPPLPVLPVALVLVEPLDGEDDFSWLTP